MKVLVMASSNVEGIYCEHAIVEIDADKKKTILDRRGMFEGIKNKDSDAWVLEFWDYVATFYENLRPDEWLDDEARAKFEMDEWLVLPEGLKVPDVEAIRTDGDRLGVNESAFWCSANDKYGDAHFETRAINYQMLEVIT